MTDMVSDNNEIFDKLAKSKPKPKTCMCKHCENYISELELSLEAAVKNLQDLDVNVNQARDIIIKQRENMDFAESFISELGAYADYIVEKQAFEESKKEEREARNARFQASKQ